MASTEKSVKLTAEGPDDVVGHKTMADGSHIPLRRAEAEAIWRQVEESDRRRKELMPTERDALNMMMDAFIRLKEFGWSEAIYCPKDGTSFEVIEAGSTGIFPCHYEGKWPAGTWWIEEDGGMPSRPILFRRYPADEEAHQAKLKAAAGRLALAQSESSHG